MEGGCTGYGVMLLIIPVSFLMPDLAFTIGSKIFACFLHEKASKYDNHHYIQLLVCKNPETCYRIFFVLHNIHVHCLQNLSIFQQTLENEVQSTVSMVSVLPGQVAFSLFTSSKFENLCWNFGFQNILTD